MKTNLIGIFKALLNHQNLSLFLIVTIIINLFFTTLFSNSLKINWNIPYRYFRFCTKIINGRKLEIKLGVIFRPKYDTIHGPGAGLCPFSLLFWGWHDWMPRVSLAESSGFLESFSAQIQFPFVSGSETLSAPGDLSPIPSPTRERTDTRANFTSPHVAYLLKFHHARSYSNSIQFNK